MDNLNMMPIVLSNLVCMVIFFIFGCWAGAWFAISKRYEIQNHVLRDLVKYKKLQTRRRKGKEKGRYL